MHGIGVRIGKGAVCLAVFLGVTPMTFAQAPLKRTVLESAPPPVVTNSDFGLRVTVGPGFARCRTLLGEIARLAGGEIRNLAYVPDVEVYVDFSAAPVVSVVDTILGYARADFIRLGTNSPGFVVAVFDRRSSDVRALVHQAGDSPVAEQRGTENLAVPPRVELPALDSSSGPADSVAGRPLDVRPEVIQIERAPTWQPLDMTPVPVVIPIGMTPQSFPIPAPPPANASAKSSPPARGK